MAQPATWPVERFRATLDRILGETGLPQAGLAALVPMDQSQLSRWKSGSSRPKFESLTVLGEALQAKYPSLGIGPQQLLDAAGYGSPTPSTGVTDTTATLPNPPPVGIRIRERDDGRVTYEVTVESDLTMDEVREELGTLTDVERLLMYNLEISGFEPGEILGAVRIHRARITAKRLSDTA